MSAAGPDRPALTLAQRRLLRAIRAGYKIQRPAKSGAAYTLIAPNGAVDSTVYSKTVHALVTLGLVKWVCTESDDEEPFDWALVLTHLGRQEVGDA